MKILRTSDKVSIKHGEIEVIVSPPTYAQKIELMNCFKLAEGKDTIDFLKSSLMSLKFAVKEVNGIKTHLDEDYKVELKDGVLSDDCASELLSAFANTPLIGAISTVQAGILDFDGVDIKVINRPS